jgi:hypothetical protein
MSLCRLHNRSKQKLRFPDRKSNLTSGE